MDSRDYKWYHPILILLHFIAVLLWIYFFTLSVIHHTSIWIKIFWIVMLIITISNIYHDRQIFKYFFHKKK